jgi:hypothetical protein
VTYLKALRDKISAFRTRGWRLETRGWSLQPPASCLQSPFTSLRSPVSSLQPRVQPPTSTWAPPVSSLARGWRQGTSSMSLQPCSRLEAHRRLSSLPTRHPHLSVDPREQNALRDGGDSCCKRLAHTCQPQPPPPPPGALTFCMASRRRSSYMHWPATPRSIEYNMKRGARAAGARAARAAARPRGRTLRADAK